MWYVVVLVACIQYLIAGSVVARCSFDSQSLLILYRRHYVCRTFSLMYTYIVHRWLYVSVCKHGRAKSYTKCMRHQRLSSSRCCWFTKSPLPKADKTISSSLWCLCWNDSILYDLYIAYEMNTHRSHVCNIVHCINVVRDVHTTYTLYLSIWAVFSIWFGSIDCFCTIIHDFFSISICLRRFVDAKWNFGWR